MNFKTFHANNAFLYLSEYQDTLIYKALYVGLKPSTSSTVLLICLKFLIYLRTILIFSPASYFVSSSWQAGATSD